MNTSSPLYARFVTRRKIVRCLRDSNPKLLNRIKAYFRLLYGLQCDEHGNRESELIGTNFSHFVDYLLTDDRDSDVYIFSSFNEKMNRYPVDLQFLILKWILQVIYRYDNYEQFYTD